MIKLRTLRWRDYPGLSGWAQYNHEAYKRETGGVKVRIRRCDNRTRDWDNEF